MKLIKTIRDIREKVATFKKSGKKISLVPTMGALHQGHTSLINLAQQHANEVIVSIYVNPRQFAPDEDFEEYPRTLTDDLQKCEELGVSAVFAPSDAIMYGDESYLGIQINELNKYMEGGSRSGFFEGILLVVNKLFNIIEPDVAFFGQKDIQQFRILQQMVREFNHNIKLLMAPIIRANDGLAISSRNQYLSKKEREKAPGLYRSLRYVKTQIQKGVKNPELLLNHQKTELEEKGFKIDYLSVFSFDKMKPVSKLRNNQKYILGGAVYVGNTRLIDNMILELKD
jgi:pantoate--beta-alanine ligase